MSLGESMRQDWDKRARKNAFYYIASWRKDWDAASFLQSGEEDYQRLIARYLDRHLPAARRNTLLELGCGAGRMTQSFARRFARVIAFDVSEGMLRRAGALVGASPNITWMQGNGANLSGVESESVDCVSSYLVLQHLPSEGLALGYVREMLRVLKPGGILLFQFNSLPSPGMNWKGRIAWGIVDALWDAGLNRASRAMASAFGFDPDMAGRSWHGASVRPARVVETLRNAGGTLLELSGEGTAMTWCCGVKAESRDGG